MNKHKYFFYTFIAPSILFMKFGWTMEMDWKKRLEELRNDPKSEEAARKYREEEEKKKKEAMQIGLDLYTESETKRKNLVEEKKAKRRDAFTQGGNKALLKFMVGDNNIDELSEEQKRDMAAREQFYLFYYATTTRSGHAHEPLNPFEYFPFLLKDQKETCLIPLKDVERGSINNRPYKFFKVDKDRHQHSLSMKTLTVADIPSPSEINELLIAFFDTSVKGDFTSDVKITNKTYTADLALKLINKFSNFGHMDQIFSGKKISPDVKNSWILTTSSVYTESKTAEKFNALLEKGIVVRTLEQIIMQKSRATGKPELAPIKYRIIDISGQYFYFTTQQEFEKLNFEDIRDWDWDNFGYFSLPSLLIKRVKDLSKYAK